MDDQTMPWTNTTAFLADVIDKGGSAGRTLDVRQRDDSSWDVVLILDGGYSDRDAAEASLAVETENLSRAYIADVNAGHIEPAAAANLARVGLKDGEGTNRPHRP